MVCQWTSEPVGHTAARRGPSTLASCAKAQPRPLHPAPCTLHPAPCMPCRTPAFQTANSGRLRRGHTVGGLQPFHQKSTCLMQSTLGPYVVQIWSRNTPKSGPNDTRVLHRVEASDKSIVEQGTRCEEEAGTLSHYVGESHPGSNRAIQVSKSACLLLTASPLFNNGLIRGFHSVEYESFVGPGFRGVA